MSLEFYCRWSSTAVAYKEFFNNYLKYWGSIVGGVLLSLEFYGRQADGLAFRYKIFRC